MRRMTTEEFKALIQKLLDAVEVTDTKVTVGTTLEVDGDVTAPNIPEIDLTSLTDGTYTLQLVVADSGYTFQWVEVTTAEE